MKKVHNFSEYKRINDPPYNMWVSAECTICKKVIEGLYPGMTPCEYHERGFHKERPISEWADGDGTYGHYICKNCKWEHRVEP